MLQHLSDIDLQPVWLSLKLATLTTLFLLALTIPLAWWLSREGNKHFKGVIGALATLPLVLPPGVELLSIADAWPARPYWAVK